MFLFASRVSNWKTAAVAAALVLLVRVPVEDTHLLVDTASPSLWVSPTFNRIR